MITKDTDSDDLNYTKEQLLDVISVVEDPDIGISIVDMGLIYDVEFKKEEKKVDVEMTLTSPACPYGQQLISEVEYVLKTCKGVEDVDLEIVWEPTWSMEMMKEEIRLEMGLD
ncbi:MAG: DUF59 domain-containing protein [Lentisphaeria bacterium]|nr:metal-sulfur cluster assembly factor [Lentisphaeria bacterium]NQZ67951.1 DUF59 domain-containing protein [Lentisphaeria bacterium]